MYYTYYIIFYINTYYVLPNPVWNSATSGTRSRPGSRAARHSRLRDHNFDLPRHGKKSTKTSLPASRESRPDKRAQLTFLVCRVHPSATAPFL